MHNNNDNNNYQNASMWLSTQYKYHMTDNYQDNNLVKIH